MFVFLKICHALFSFYLRFENHPCALLPTILDNVPMICKEIKSIFSYVFLVIFCILGFCISNLFFFCLSGVHMCDVSVKHECLLDA